MKDLNQLVQNQRNFYNSGVTKTINFRKKQLLLLKNTILKNIDDISLALKKDLNKSDFESYETEIGIVLDEIGTMTKHLKKYSSKKRVSTSLMHFPSKSYIIKEPYGIALIISPWNYPFQLSIAPLIGAIAAGNCAVIKPSEHSVNTSHILQKLISENFDENYITVIQGDVETNKKLLEIKFDIIFFTGSVKVGKIVMSQASKHLTPVILELGGKSPCIVDETANINLSAKRIIWGKGVNAGQTCVAPDYILVHSSVKNQLLTSLKKNIIIMYGDNSEMNKEYPKIINTINYNRISELIKSGEVYYGGKQNANTNQTSLAILDKVKWADKIMEEEIFGPILPIISYDSLDEEIKKINSKPKPLALYLFSTSKKTKKLVTTNVSYGGGCINDTLIHFVSSLPFGGVGDSGIGSYHGKTSFDVFSHEKGIIEKSILIDIPLRYPPFKNNLKLLKRILK